MDAKTDTAPIEVLEDLLASRFSCRAFLPQPVPRAIIERILAAAQKTASWCNSQPWQLVIASGAATRKFRDVMYGAASSGKPNSGDFPFPREYRGVYLERRRESGFQLYNSLGIPRGDKAGYARQALENFNFFGAPHVAIVHTDEALDKEVDRLAATLAGNAPRAMAGMKRAINEFARGTLDEEAADRRHRDSMRSAEISEGIAAFAEKRPPKF